tara:strand:+ start:3139 stop:3585 length:447 start_codon:yes stop_codon:yes gene_type:complete
MIDIAMVGYKHLITERVTEDLIIYLPELIQNRKEVFNGFNVCYQDIIEERDGRGLNQLVDGMIKTNPDILCYLNYRDYYLDEADKRDGPYLRRVRELKPDLPILLFSGSSHHAKEFAEELKIPLLEVPFRLQAFIGTIEHLSGKKKEN